MVIFQRNENNNAVAYTNKFFLLGKIDFAVDSIDEGEQVFLRPPGVDSSSAITVSLRLNPL